MTAEEVYADPSALARLYLHQTGSREICSWRSRVAGALPVTHHGRTELVNALCRSAFLGILDRDGLDDVLAEVEADFSEGRLHLADVLWRAALNRAAELSRRHTPGLGTRASDVLHVATAIELGLPRFLSFDERQQRLAVAVGLKRVRV